MFSESVGRVYSSCFMHAIVVRMRLPFFKLFSNFVHTCPNFKIFCPFLSFLALFLKNHKHAVTFQSKPVRALRERFFEIWASGSLENAFPTHFLGSNHTLFIADKHHSPPREYYGLVIKYTKSYHPNRCIKVGNKPPRLPCWQVKLIFFNNQT